MLDLDIDRDQPMEARGRAQRRRRGHLPAQFRGRIVCKLPTELPLDVLEPLTHVTVDLGLTLRIALGTARTQDPQVATMDVIDMVVDQLIINRSCPTR